MENKNPLQRATAYVGSATALAKILGISKGAISQWGDEIPAEHCPSIEKATNGTVKCEELNSHTDWAYLRESSNDELKENTNVIPD
jgi:DNA-binding transcriptional regulator YdaS (Cro superfamily)